MIWQVATGGAEEPTGSVIGNGNEDTVVAVNGEYVKFRGGYRNAYGRRTEG